MAITRHLRFAWAIIIAVLALCLVSSVAFAAEEGDASPEVLAIPVADAVEGEDIADSIDAADDSVMDDSAPAPASVPAVADVGDEVVTVIEGDVRESVPPIDESVTEPEAVIQEAGDADAGDAGDSGEGEGEGEGTDSDPPAVNEPTKTSIAGAAVSGYKATYTYTGKAIAPKVKVVLGGKTLIAGTDYKLTYASNDRAGKATITISGVGSYEGALSVPFSIAKKSLKKLKIKACKRQVYSGGKLKPVPTIKLGKIVLKKGVDFTVAYKNNKKLGTAKMIIKGKGNFKGKVVKKFKIVPTMVVAIPERYYFRTKETAEWLAGFGIKAVWVKNPDASLKRFDGMVIPGGVNDVDPRFYGEKVNGADRPDPVLDRLQIKLIKRFAKTGKPILGICRGGQIMNVAFGGTLYQEIGRHKGYIKTKVVKNTWLSAVGKTTLVYHYHHQAVKDLAKNFKVSAWNYKGKRKVIEGYEHETKPIYGVQYHPEMSGSGGTKLALLFKKTCAKYM